MGVKILKAIAWTVGGFLVFFLILAFMFRTDPIVILSVRTIFVAVASTVSDAKELKDAIKHDIKSELKK